jgi:anti-sigma regulatory factor (Ser/Thr protein kinase)
LANTPDSLLASEGILRKLVQRAVIREHQGHGIFMLDNCPAMDAGTILLLMYAGFQLSRIGWKASVSGKGEAMDLVVRHLEHYLRDRKNRSSVARIEGDYLLREIDSRDGMVREIGGWAESVQRETNASKREVALWKTQISEVTTNGFQHGIGSSPPLHPMLIAGRASNDGKMVQLAALDFGKSIPSTIDTVANKQSVPNGHGDRISFACKKGVTSRTLPVNQGAGLFKLVETVKKNGGTLLILSGNGLVHVSNGRCYRRNLKAPSSTTPILQGTLTVVNLRIS